MSDGGIVFTAVGIVALLIWATLPMGRLAEYLSDLATLFGERPYVHFVQIEDGSTELVQDVEYEAYPKVRTRVHDVKRGEGPADARRAYDALNRRLADDNASGVLVEEAEPQTPPARVLEFPGRRTVVEPEYGPVSQNGSLQGIVIVVGGESDPVPVHIEDGEQVHLCLAKRQLAKELAKHIFASPVRVDGTGRWFRDAAGTWTMRSFQIASFLVLEDAVLSNVIATLRQVPAKWKDQRDSLGRLHALRHGET